MNAVQFFNAMRDYKRSFTGNPHAGLAQADVDAANEIIKSWAPKPNNSPRKVSQRGINLIHQFESCKLTTYPDPGSRDGKPVTGGWGTTADEQGRPFALGVTYPQDYWDRLFARDLDKFEEGVTRLLVDAPTTQEQFDALVSFAYNVGFGRKKYGEPGYIPGLGNSTLLRKHKAGDYEGAAQEFKRWNRNDGAIQRGLVRRRGAEEALYRMGMR